MRVDRKPKGMDMYPPGRVMFLRPLKVARKGGLRRVTKLWDAVWVAPSEVVDEGILVSGRVRNGFSSKVWLITSEHNFGRLAVPTTGSVDVGGSSRCGGFEHSQPVGIVDQDKVLESWR